MYQGLSEDYRDQRLKVSLLKCMALMKSTKPKKSTLDIAVKRTEIYEDAVVVFDVSQRMPETEGYATTVMVRRAYDERRYWP